MNILSFIERDVMSLPKQFVYLADIDSTIIQDIKYFSDDNFIGRRIAGYEAPVCILTKPAALALNQIQQKLLPQQLSLKVFDGYRPQTAVNDFIVWSQDASDQKQKSQFYPRVNKADFFKLGFVAEKSGHTRGSTVDLTIVQLSGAQVSHELDMGTPFDLMDETSHTMNPAIKGNARENRLLLRDLMMSVGFKPYPLEWWHFTLAPEPFPDTYFDFLVK